MTKYVISSGATEALHPAAGDTLSVLRGGTSLESVISGGAAEYVFSSGQSIFDSIEAGAIQVVESGGRETAATVLGSQYVYGVASGDLISGTTAYQFVEAGGSAMSATLVDLAYQSALNGGVTVGTQVSSGGVEFVLSGGFAASTTVLGNGSAVISAGGTASSVTVASGGALGGAGNLIGANTDAGLVANVSVGDPIHPGYLEVLSGGVALDVAVVDFADSVTVDSGGTATGTVVTSGAELLVFGVASGTTVSHAGLLTVFSGGLTFRDTVLSGATENVLTGGSADGVTVSAGGVLSGAGTLLDINNDAGLVQSMTVGDALHPDSLIVLAGGVARDVTVVGADDFLSVNSGGTATGTVVSSGGALGVLGSASATAIQSAGAETVDSGGHTSGDVVMSGGVETLLSGGTGDTLTVAAGGMLSGPGTLTHYNSAAGTVIGVSVGDDLFADTLEMLSGGVASNVTVFNGSDVLKVDSGAAAVGTTLSGGGFDIVYGAATDTTVGIVSIEQVSSGGKTTSAVILSGGTERLASGAIGGALTVSAGGMASGPGELIGANSIYGATSSVTVSGGSETVYAGGVAMATTVLGGGVEVISSGGTASGATVSGGGRIVIEAGATIQGLVTGQGAGKLELAGGTGTLAGMANGSVTVSGATASPAAFTNFASLSIDPNAHFTTAGAESISTGRSLVVDGSLTVGGTLSVSGSLTVGGTATGARTLAGTGTLALAGATLFGAGAQLTVAHVTQGGAAAVTFGETALTYAGVWAQTAGTLSVAAGDLLTFTGTGDVFDGVLAGAGTMRLIGGADRLAGTKISIAHLNINNAAAVTFAGAVTNTGAITAANAHLVIAATGATLTGGGTLTLTNAAVSKISGASAGATLTNVNNLIAGAGQLGGGQMALANQAAGRIEGSASGALVIDTGASTIQNAGSITASGAGGVTIKSAIDNSGLLVAAGGKLELDKAVTGAGSARINGGTLFAAAAFSQNVTFTGTTGVLELAQSQTYAGKVAGLSHTGTDSLDLRDIGFVSATEAIFSGNAAGGTLTVTDGAHTAKIKLVGNYVGVSFVASSDGHGGTTVVDPLVAAAVRSFTTAIAAIGPPDGAASTPTGHGELTTSPRLLAHPTA